MGEAALTRPKVFSPMFAAPSRQRTRASAFHNRKVELNTLRSRLLRKPKAITVIIGPVSTGKTALLKNLLSDWEDSERTLYIDCREGDFTTPEKFAQAVLKRISPAWPNWLPAFTAVLDLAGIKLSAMAVDPSLTVKLKDLKDVLVTATAEKPMSLNMVIEAFDRLIMESSTTKVALPPALIVIDEANALTDWDLESHKALKALLNFFIRVSKQENTAHVILATSDNFLPSWLEKNGVNPAFFEVFTVGNLPEDEARAVFQQLLQEEATAPPVSDSDWTAIYGVCGGNVGVLGKCIASACSTGSWMRAVSDVEDAAAADLLKGLYPELLTAANWSVDEYRVMVSIIAASEHGAVPIKAIVEAIGRNRALVVLPSFLSANRLSLRQRSDMALDLPSQIFANETTLYVLPTVAHLKQARALEEFKNVPPCCGEGSPNPQPSRRRKR